MLLHMLFYVRRCLAFQLYKYPGPVDVGIVARKLKQEHPAWKLPERRVNKFVKRYQSQHKNPAGADDDETVATAQKVVSSPRNLFRLFSPKSKSSALTEEVAAGVAGANQESAPTSPKAPPSPAQVADEVEPEVSPEKATPDEEPDETTLAEVPSRDMAYDTDDNIVNSKELCHCEACSIM